MEARFNASEARINRPEPHANHSEGGVNRWEVHFNTWEARANTSEAHVNCPKTAKIGLEIGGRYSEDEGMFWVKEIRYIWERIMGRKGQK